MKNFIILILIVFSSRAFSQCQPTFTATPGPGGTVTFNVTSSSASNVVLTNWYYGDGIEDTNLTVNPTHTYQYNYNNYEVCVTVLDTALGCYDSSCMRLNITNAAQDMACPGNAAFTATQSGTQTVITNNSGSLFNINGYAIGLSPIALQFQLAGVYNVTTVSYRSVNGYFFPCDTFTAPVTVSYVGCNLGMVTQVDTLGLYQITAEAYPHIGYTNYAWYINGAFYSNAIYFQTPNYFPEGTYTISLVATGPGGCYDSIAQVVDFYYTLPCPGISFTQTKLPPCDDYQFDAIGMTGSNTVEWYLDNVLQSTSPSATINVPFPTGFISNAQRVTGVVYGPNCIASETFYIWNPASFHVDLDTSGAINTWYVYDNIPSGLITSELWDFGDGFTSTLSAPTHIYTTPGYYDLCHTVTLVNGCTYDYCYNNYFFRPSANPVQVIVLAQTTGIEEEYKESSLKLYPNPTNNKLFLETNSINIRSCVINSLEGKQVFKQEFSNELNVSNISSGIYILELLNQQNQSVVRKLFMKE